MDRKRLRNIIMYDSVIMILLCLAEHTTPLPPSIAHMRASQKAARQDNAEGRITVSLRPLKVYIVICIANL